MGNSSSTLSTQSPQDQHRPSKPKTSTPSANLPSPSKKGSNHTSTITSETPDSTRPSSLGRPSLTQDEREKLRAEIFSPETGTVSRQQTHKTLGEDRIAALANTVREHLSRSGSLRSQASNSHMATAVASTAASSKMSLLPEQAADLDLAGVIHILQELKKTAPPEDLIALHKALLPTRRSLASTQPPQADAAISRGATTRRSGMHMPGLATRGAPTDVLRKPESVTVVRSDVEDSNRARREMMDNSPLTRLEAMKNFLQVRDIPIPRAGTPENTDYARIGKMLGPLRVMNGPATPEPGATPKGGAIVSATVLDVHIHDDYVPAPEGRESTEVLFHRQQIQTSLPQDSFRTARSPNYPEPTLDITSYQRPSGDENVPALAAEPEDSLLKQELVVESVAGIKAAATTDVTSSIALDYMAELSSGPYTRSSSPTRHTPITATKEIFVRTSGAGTKSTHSPMPALHVLGLDEINSFKMVVDEAMAERTFPLMLTMPKSAMPKPAPLRHSSHSSSIYVDDSSTPPDSKPASLILTDSGYNSENSIKGLTGRNSHSDAKPDEVDLPLPTERCDDKFALDTPQITANKEGAPSLYTLEEMLSIVPPSSEVKGQIKAQEPTSPSKKFSSRLLQLRSKSFRKESKKGPAPSPLADLNPNIGTEMAAKSAVKAPAGPGPKKLQKQRPLSHTVLATSVNVQPAKENDTSSIPNVPEQIAENFGKRLSDDPSKENVVQGLKSRQDTTSRESLKVVPADSASPGKSSSSDTGKAGTARNSWFSRRTSDRKTSNQSVRRQRSNSAKNMCVAREESPESGSDMTRAEETLVTGVADFGNIAHQLGGSPYDIAMMTATLKPTQTASRGVLEPHQMGAAFPRPRRMMDEEAATEFARRRSHDIQTARGPRVFPRPKSYHGQEVDDQGSNFAKISRLHAICIEVPPVPALPTGQPLDGPSPIEAEAQLGIHPAFRNQQGRSNDSLTSLHGPRAAPAPAVEQQAERYELDGTSCPRPAVSNPRLAGRRQSARTNTSPVYHQSLQPLALPARLQAEPAATDSNSTLKRDGGEILPEEGLHQIGPKDCLQQTSISTQPPVEHLRSKSVPPAAPWHIAHQYREPRAPASAKPSELATPAASESQQLNWDASAALWRKRRQTVGRDLFAQSNNNTNSTPASIQPQSRPHSKASSPTRSGPPSYRTSPDTSASVTRTSSPMNATSKSNSTSNLNANSSSNADFPRPRLARAKSSAEAILDRYGGGFDYEYEHGLGVGGSAGTRSVHSEASRKSRGDSVRHGLDLSDIPVFLQRV